MSNLHSESLCRGLHILRLSGANGLSSSGTIIIMISDALVKSEERKDMFVFQVPGLSLWIN